MSHHNCEHEQAADKLSVVSASFYMVGHHLMDPHLRLLPQGGATPIPNLNLKKE